MKKIIISAACAIMGAIAMASTYQVYDLKMTVKTTAAKGVVEADCGDYVYRDKANAVIKGVIGGCGCGSILADGTCNNAVVYLWDETHKIAITNVEMTSGWNVQRIGKKQNVVEHFVRLEATYGNDNEYRFDVVLAGFGTYQKNTKDDNASYVSSISGNFAGVSTAPWYFRAGKCSACHIEDDMIEPTLATSLCESCGESGMADFTPFYGTYTVKYSSSKSSKCTKTGLSVKNLGLPVYLTLGDFAATNID